MNNLSYHFKRLLADKSGFVSLGDVVSGLLSGLGDIAKTVAGFFGWQSSEKIHQQEIAKSQQRIKERDQDIKKREQKLKAGKLRLGYAKLANAKDIANIGLRTAMIQNSPPYTRLITWATGAFIAYAVWAFVIVPFANDTLNLGWQEVSDEGKALLGMGFMELIGLEFYKLKEIKSKAAKSKSN